MLSELHVACAVSQMTIVISYTTVNVEFVVGPKTRRLVIVGLKCSLVFHGLYSPRHLSHPSYHDITFSSQSLSRAQNLRWYRHLSAPVVSIWTSHPTNDIVVTVTVSQPSSMRFKARVMHSWLHC